MELLVCVLQVLLQSATHTAPIAKPYYVVDQNSDSQFRRQSIGIGLCGSDGFGFWNAPCGGEDCPRAASSVARRRCVPASPCRGSEPSGSTAASPAEPSLFHVMVRWVSQVLIASPKSGLGFYMASLCPCLWCWLLCGQCITVDALAPHCCNPMDKVAPCLDDRLLHVLVTDCSMS